MNGGQSDVYAGDTAFSGDGTPPGAGFICEYRIRADADPDVLCRVANQLNYANAAPWRVELVQDDEGIAIISVEMRDIRQTVSESIRRKLMQQTCVIEVSIRPIQMCR